MTQILIVDDHRVVAEGIAEIIRKDEEMSVVDIAGTIAEAVECAGNQASDIILLDVALPDGDGIEAIPQLLDANSQLRVIIFTMYAESAVVQRAIKAGAHGYLLKSVSVEELISGIKEVAAGGTFICKEAQELCANNNPSPPVLTMRERQVLALIVQGKTIKEISEQLFLGFETVHSYTKYLRQKLNCSNTASLVRVAIEQHLV